MKTIVLIIFTFVCVCFCSCNFVRNERIFGKYHILAVDMSKDLCLAYELEDGNYICIVKSKVLAYYKNEKYIFVKQIPYEIKDTLNVNYYIVPILENNPDVFPEDAIVGPLNEEKFNNEISKMKLKEIKFKKLD